MADKMTRCPEGHFYDPTKHNSCPWCALPADIEGGEKTRPVAGPPPLPPGFVVAPPPPPPPPPLPPPPPPPVPKPGATRRQGAEVAGAKNDPVVGWMVCLTGPDRGRDFRL